ncbi:hypothetical protein [Oceanithermus sp.]|uniref:hypothetical protein n=1 Tax=Oceanithermus sp. TaxID=2268145 RepID=UPI00257D5838|nr:hypothetical protein [Oceanithermus sp.]
MAEDDTKNTPTNTPNDDTQGAPQAGDNQAPAPEAGGNDDTPRTGEEWMAKELKRAREEAAKYRTRAKELAAEAEKAKTLEEKLAALEAEKAELAKAADVAKQLERRLELTTVLGDPKLAELVEPHADKFTGEDGKFDAEKFFAEFPHLKQAQSTPVRGANPGHPTGGLTREQIAKMSPEEYEKRRGEIMEALRSGKL